MHGGKPRVSDYYEKKTIFITGATGFLGKVLLWKLLHSCSNFDTIYLLLRPKRAENVENRLQELFQTPVSTRRNTQRPPSFTHLTYFSDIW